MRSSVNARTLLSLVVASHLAGCGGDDGTGPGDMAPPTVPTDLTAELVAENTVNLTWSPSVDDVAVTGYRIYREGTSIGTAPGSAYTDGEAPFAEICYTVTAFDAAGNESGQSNPACLDLPRSWIVRAAGVETDLEAAAWSGTTFVAVGPNGADTDKFMVSTDGSHWLPRHHQRFSGGTAIEWDGAEFVAVTDLGIYISPDGLSGNIEGEDPWIGLDTAADLVFSGSELIAVGPQGRIFGSQDGITWMERTSNATQDLAGVCSSGDQLVAVGNGGTIVTSPDGVTWTAQTPGTPGDLAGVASTGSRFLALGFGEMLSSPDATAWSPASVPAGEAIAIAGSPDLDLFAAVGYNGMIATSPDGVTWTPRSTTTPHAFADVTWAGDRFVAVGETGAIATSTDGVTWDLSASGDNFTDVSWLGDRLVAVGTAGMIAVSTDGIDWTRGWTGDGTYVGQDIAWSGSVYVIGGYMSLLSSPDLQTWTPYSLGPQECRSVIWTGSVFAAACTGSAVRISPDGTTWTAYFVDGSFATDVNSITWTGSQFVAVGEGGLIATSSDGSVWSPQTSGVLGRLFGVASSGTRIVAVGEAGAIVTSTDGINWTAQPSAPETLSDVSWLDDQFVTVGGNHTILLSPDGLTWDDRSTVDSYPLMKGVSAVNGKIVVVGEDGTILMSP